MRLDLVDEPVGPGDYVLNHVGYAIRRIPAEEIQGTLDLYETLLAEGGQDDPMASDVRGELSAARDTVDRGQPAADSPARPGRGRDPA